ncbi:MAG: protein-L-isoaspartate(D-aspartate) O-methyltransferase [Deltaproteobacteria bacterium]|nr:protein-L-isoaspartate(D-aspartate) O-methyltransferase [Deltaproteobacteria bacterium]
MVDEQIVRRGVRDARVLKAMRRVRRHEFVPKELRERAYEDGPLPIGEGQTISQPFIVAFMSEALDLKGEEKVLEIGTGSGYQAAVLTLLAREVLSIEIVAMLAKRAEETFRRLGYTVRTKTGDGYLGWPNAAPFEAILVTAAADHVPQALKDQLAIGGRLVMPIGPPEEQEIVRLTKFSDGWKREVLLQVRFVPMTGRAKDRRGRR